MGSIPLPHKVRVCIIGAGVAGLGAAQKLAEAGIKDVVVLEAQDRIGGRVHTEPFGLHVLEHGAQWIHGEEGNVVYDWAHENDLIDDEASLTQTGIGETTFVRQDGEVVSEEISDRFQRLMGNITEGSEEDLIAYSDSYGKFVLERFKKENQWGKLGEEMAEWYGRFQNCIDGTESWFESSAKGHTVYKECPGNPVVNWREKGYQNLLDYLKKNLDPSCIHLKTPVKQIDWNEAALGLGNYCSIHLEAGGVIRADHIIFTASLAVLKNCSKSLFNPVLPDFKLKAIDGLGIGVVNKIYLKFPNQWWPKDCDGFSFLHDADSAPPVITEENWEYGLLGFYEVFKQPNMMCAWITGQAAELMESADEKTVSQRCTAILRKYLSNRFEIPDAVWCKRTTWGSNPWIRGSYSFRSVKSEILNVSAADLAKPLCSMHNAPVICFAGEATHDYFYSTVHGALETGWREAKRLLEYFQSTQESSEIGLPELRDKYQVIIVGCGAAGLGAAKELNSHGIKSVLIIEGSDRIGGRVNTIKTGSQSHLDLGAQWIHGEVGNEIYKFSMSKDLLYDFLSVDGEGEFYTEYGQLIADNIVEDVKAVLDKADEELQHMSNAPLDFSVGEFFKRRFSEYLANCRGEDPSIIKHKHAVYEWYVRWQRVDNACDCLQTLSANCWGTYIFCEGKENMSPKHGFSTIIKALRDEVNADVILRTEVKSIDYTSKLTVQENRYVRQDGTTFPVIVKCKNGREFEAQHVVVTSSIGYLKRHLDMFSPGLPQNLQKVILSTGFGTINKIFLEFDKPFWSDDCEGLHFVWTDHIPYYDEVSTRPTVGSNPEMMKSRWFKSITGFDPVPHQQAVLCGWIGGLEAEYMEKLPETEVAHTCVELLRQFTGRKDIPIPKQVYRSKWSTNDLICGSYSYHAIPCKYRANLQLNSPVCAKTNFGKEVPVLVLAGEANSAAYYSTVHGAFQNGMSQVSHYINALTDFGGSIGSVRSKI